MTYLFLALTSVVLFGLSHTIGLFSPSRIRRDPPPGDAAVRFILAAPLLLAGWALIGISITSSAGIGAGGWV